MTWRAVPGLVDVRSSLEAGSPELQVVFDRARLATLGLDMRVLSETLRDRVQGAVPTRFKEEDRQIDIRVRNREYRTAPPPRTCATSCSPDPAASRSGSPPSPMCAWSAAPRRSTACSSSARRS